MVMTEFVVLDDGVIAGDVVVLDECVDLIVGELVGLSECVDVVFDEFVVLVG